jgi:hypothetical protein
MSDMIADCLRAKGVRYFHGHNDWEYFFLLDYLDQLGAGEPSAEFRHGTLHVHLDRGGAPDEITVTVTPDRYFPAVDREHLMNAAAGWELGGSGTATVYPSSDPHLVGVLIQATGRPTGVAELTALVDDTVAAALDLFGRMRRAAASTQLRDAG